MIYLNIILEAKLITILCSQKFFKGSMYGKVDNFDS